MDDDCPICGEVFRGQSNLKQHEDCHDLEDAPSRGPSWTRPAPLQAQLFSPRVSQTRPQCRPMGHQCHSSMRTVRKEGMEVDLLLSGPVPTPSPIGALSPDLAPEQVYEGLHVPHLQPKDLQPDLAQCRFMGVLFSHCSGSRPSPIPRALCSSSRARPSLALGMTPTPPPSTPLSRPCTAGLRGALSSSRSSKIVSRSKINKEDLALYNGFKGSGVHLVISLGDRA